MSRFAPGMSSALVVALAVTAIAAVPSLVNYQGVLQDGSGNPLPDGNYSVKFHLYDDPTAGTLLWAETLSVNTTGGVYSVLLGGVHPLSDAAFAGPDRYVGMAVGADPEMLPRQRIVTVAFAHRISTVDGASGGNITSKVSIGPDHTATGAYTFVAGRNNAATADYAVVAGGWQNNASAEYATIGGGARNRAWGQFSVVGGGGGNAMDDSNSAKGDYSFIGGGHRNFAHGESNTIGGGVDNITDNYWSTIGGGNHNWAGAGSTVAGGWINASGGLYSTIGGGAWNRTWGQFSVVGGGGGNAIDDSNSASGDYSFIGGGHRNFAHGESNAIGGGVDNITDNYFTFIGGGSHNWAGAGAAIGGGNVNAAGGLYASIGGGSWNRAWGQFAVVAGGGGNAISDSNSATGDVSTIGGGRRNVVSALGATVSGGQTNVASAAFATVPGGVFNTASGRFAFAAGRHVAAIHDGSFVWGDSLTSVITSPGVNTFSVRASGGIWLGTTSAPSIPATDFLNTSTGAHLTTGGVWTNSSDRDAKENFAEIDRGDLLQRISILPIRRWNYKAEGDSVVHIGPVAQDFHALFGLGTDDKTISTIDPSGIALAAIQALYKRNQELEAAVTKLQSQFERIEEGLATRPK